MAQLVECMFNSVISPYYVSTAIAAYFFSWDDSGKDSSASCDNNSGGWRYAGNTTLPFLLDYFHVTEIFSVHDFFELMAEEMVEDLLDAEIVVTDHETVCSDGAEIIREHDFERLRALMGE